MTALCWPINWRCRLIKSYSKVCYKICSFVKSDIISCINPTGFNWYPRGDKASNCPKDFVRSFKFLLFKIASGKLILVFRERYHPLVSLVIEWLSLHQTWSLFYPVLNVLPSYWTSFLWVCMMYFFLFRSTSLCLYHHTQVRPTANNNQFFVW